MDPISIAFYALICGLLGLVAPNIKGAVPRVAIGAAVGVVAALILPALRAVLGL